MCMNTTVTELGPVVDKKASKPKYHRHHPSWKEATLYITFGTQVSVAVVAFSLNLPFLFTPSAAIKTFQFASWVYEDGLSHFDNTGWTYGTDYILGLAMWVLSQRVPRNSRFQQAGILSRGLLFCYLLSVTAGAIAHQFFTTTDARNTASFRYLWTVCVGTVAAGSGFMGATATALHRLDLENSKELVIPILNIKAILVQEWFWVGYALVVSSMVALGSFSCQRPACDIFIVGITQFPSTFYMMLLLKFGLRDIPGIQPYMRWLGCLGFILNAPLLPLYPILVNYTNWSLASVNTLLHSWLLVAWSLQGLTLRHVGKAIVRKEKA